MEPRVERAGQGVVRQIFCYTHRQGNCTTVGVARGCAFFIRAVQG